MVDSLRHYEVALGLGVKHPVATEAKYRGVLYKKVVEDSPTMLRADSGHDYISHQFENFNRDSIGVGVIARLKSERLEQKVLKPFHNDIMIVDLVRRVSQCDLPVVLATSSLPEDAPLIDVCKSNGIKTFTGHPVSVLDRLLWLSYENQWGGVFRVTGDNPFTDPGLMKKMRDLFIEHELDYVRCNNVPFGVSGELFSVPYLWKLYLAMQNPLHSEYLSYFILKDNNARRGCIDLIGGDEQIKYLNLSVDYQDDLNRCYKVLQRIDSKKFEDITLEQVIGSLELTDSIARDKEVRLPTTSVTLDEYLSTIENLEYTVRVTEEITWMKSQVS